MSKDLLDCVSEQFRNNKVDVGMEMLFTGLRELRLSQRPGVWQKTVHADLRAHPISEIVKLDPMTRRSFLKPRGYPGDAVLLDMVYRHSSFRLARVPKIGQEIYEFIASCHAARAVRYRRHYIASSIDYLAQQVLQPKIMSLACGHLREAELSGAIQNGAIGEYYAVDQDEKSLQTVRDDYGRFGVVTCKGSVQSIIKKQLKANNFDFIYSAGLYDYLNKKVARTLTLRLFELLADDGRLLITNFLPRIQAVGYMESFMDWHLVYRNELEMMDIITPIPRNRIERIEMFVEKQENIVFMQIQKR